jgi:hypothetical protein
LGTLTVLLLGGGLSFLKSQWALVEFLPAWQRWGCYVPEEEHSVRLEGSAQAALISRLRACERYTERAVRLAVGR